MKDRKSISILIPVLNEVERLPLLLDYLKTNKTTVPFEIIVVDGGSTDGTIEEVENTEGVKLVISEVAGRSVQMNRGAELASSEILYFLHADCTPPAGFLQLISEALSNNIDFGYFSYRFDQSKYKLQKFNERSTRRKSIFTGGGDQSLFIHRKIFFETGAFNEKLPIMEDFDLHSRLKKRYSFRILPHDATVSSRKYENNGYWRVQLINLAVFTGYYMGISPNKLADFYKKSL